MLVKKRRKVLKKGGDKHNLKPAKHAQQCMSQTKKQTIQLEIQVQSAPYTAISKTLTGTKLWKKYLKSPFQLGWMLPSKYSHTQIQCQSHMSLPLLVIADQILQHALAAVKVSGVWKFVFYNKIEASNRSDYIRYYHIYPRTEIFFPNFLACYPALYALHCNLLSQEQIDVSTGLSVSY